jgi:hypothetical protein
MYSYVPHYEIRFFNRFGLDDNDFDQNVYMNVQEDILFYIGELFRNDYDDKYKYWFCGEPGFGIGFNSKYYNDKRADTEITEIVENMISLKMNDFSIDEGCVIGEFMISIESPSHFTNDMYDRMRLKNQEFHMCIGRICNGIVRIKNPVTGLIDKITRDDLEKYLTNDEYCNFHQFN